MDTSRPCTCGHPSQTHHPRERFCRACDTCDAYEPDPVGASTTSTTSPLLTPEEFAAHMHALARHAEQESRHEKADALLCAVLRTLGYGEGVRVFEAMAKWYA